MRTIPVDLILHETALKLRELPDEHHRGLADNIDTYAVDHRAVADQWDSGAGNGAGVCQSARWLITNRLDAQAFAPGHVFAETRAMEVAIARRLADCALSLLITQDAEDAATAQTLLQAAQYVVGLATAKPSAEAALFTSTPNDRRLNVARDCLPSGVDIIACLRNDRPTTYKASNTDEEYGSPEAAVRAAWEYRQRPTQSVSDRAFKVGDKVRFARIRGGEAHRNNAPTLGWEGEITEIDGSGLPIRVEGVARGGRWATYTKHGWWFTAADLDLITPTA